MLDSTPFDALRQFDPDRMSIRIYIQASTSLVSQPAQTYPLAQTPSDPVLFRMPGRPVVTYDFDYDAVRLLVRIQRTLNIP